MDKDLNKEGIIELWNSYRRYLTVATQERIKSRVLNGWEFEKAVRNEGVIIIKHELDLSVVQEMFDDDELSVKKVKKNVLKNLKKVAPKEGMKAVAEAESESEPVYEKTEDSFVPRPKPAKGELPINLKQNENKA